MLDLRTFWSSTMAMEDKMRGLIGLGRYPLDRPASPEYDQLVEHARNDLATEGMFNLPGFLRPGVADRLAAELHPALQQVETVNHTLCAGQLGTSDLVAIHDDALLIRFLTVAMKRPGLHAMADPLARLNVMAYRAGEALNWHFDRSEFTTTLLLQAPDAGDSFEYRTDLRSDTDPNHDGVAALLQDRDPRKQSLDLAAETLSVFRGRNTAHRVTPVMGARHRVVAVFSCYDRPGVLFSAEERMGFYGRAA